MLNSLRRQYTLKLVAIAIFEPNLRHSANSWQLLQVVTDSVQLFLNEVRLADRLIPILSSLMRRQKKISLELDSN